MAENEHGLQQRICQPITAIISRANFLRDVVRPQMMLPEMFHLPIL